MMKLTWEREIWEMMLMVEQIWEKMLTVEQTQEPLLWEMIHTRTNELV